MVDDDFVPGEFVGLVGIVELPYGDEGLRIEFREDMGYPGGQGQVG